MNVRQKKPLILSIASGKGGVGKTITTVNMALAARRMGYKTLLLDGDFGLANVDIVLGLKARYTIQDVLDGEVEMEDTLLDGPLGLKIIPSGSGFARLADLKLTQRIRLLDKISEIAQEYDVLFIDTGAGISESVLHLNSVADAILLVTTPEPHAQTDAYAFVKVMCEKYGKRRISLIANQAVSDAQGHKVYQNLADVAKRFLDFDLGFAGVVPKDAVVQRSVMMQRVADDQVKHTLSGQAWNEITRKTIESLVSEPKDDSSRGLSDLLFPNFGALRAL
ncbi:MAG: MinD/ParA family protein [Chitinophagaceae bacterium]|nr:MinD/ParA family protein [Oligoflexus sp.]